MVYRCFFRSLLILFMLAAAGSASAAEIQTIHEAAQAGDIQAMSGFLEKGTGINQQNSQGKTPLLVALENGKGKAAFWLMDKGADLKQADYSQRTALYWAIRGKVPEAATRLLEKGADPNAKALGNETILSVAAVSGDAAIVKQLLDKGANPKEDGKLTDAPIYRAAQQKHFKVVKLLMPHYPVSPHVLAFFAGPKAVEAAMTSANLNIDSRLTGTKDTLLHCAAQGNNIKLATYLIRKGAALNLPNHYDQTPLHVAAEKNHPKIVKLLLKGGALVHLKSNTKQTALQMAQERKNGKCVKLLEKKETEIKKWLQAAAAGQTAKVTKLAADPVFLNATDDNGWTALHHAVKGKQQEVIAALSQAGMDMNAVNKDGESGFVMAFTANDLDTMKFMAKLPGVDKNRGNYVGLGPIHTAALKNNQPVIDLLLDAGLPINQTDVHGYTALDYAERGKHDGLVKYLAGKGAKPGDGLPPLVKALNVELAKTYAVMGKKATVLNQMAYQFTKGRSVYSINTGRQYSQQAAFYLKMQQNILALAVYLNHQEPGSPRIPVIKELGKAMNLALSGVTGNYPNFKRIEQRVGLVMGKLLDLKLAE